MKVAVYGSLRKGFHNHNAFLSKAEFLETTQTVNKYDMYSLGSYPYVDLDNQDLDTNITVEVYEIDKDILSRLDYLEGYPSFYNRTEVKLENGMAAWMYHINNRVGGYRKTKPVTSGDWLQFKQEKVA